MIVYEKTLPGRHGVKYSINQVETDDMRRFYMVKRSDTGESRHFGNRPDLLQYLRERGVVPATEQLDFVSSFCAMAVARKVNVREKPDTVGFAETAMATAFAQAKKQRR